MAHFAHLDNNNIVTNIIVISNDNAPDPAPENSEQLGIKFIEELSKYDESLKGKWVQTSYNSSFRNKYAAVGDFYSEEYDVFISASPYPSWFLTFSILEDSYKYFYWEAPVPMPQESGNWQWNEELQTWEDIPRTED